MIEKWLVLQIVLSILILIAPPFTHADVPNWLRSIGAIFFIMGLIVSIIAFFQLGSSFTPFVKPRAGSTLKTSGFYRYVRHPMYCSLVLLAFGWSLFWGTLLGMLLSFALFLILDRKASEEEKWLTKKYPEYANYKKRVKKLIPYIY